MVMALSQSAFTLKLRECLKALGYPADKYSGHNFWRGRASLHDLIKLLGDWSSNAYERYLELLFELWKQVTAKLGSEMGRLLINN